MDVRLKPFDFQAAVARAGLRPDGTPLAPPGAGAAEPGSFRTAMADALGRVIQAQMESQRLQRAVALDDPGVSLEQTMVAMQTSQIGFQAVVQVRNRMLQAYTDIMNMQV
jgi:flagellar hook-basal body complex protein FliE